MTSLVHCYNLGRVPYKLGWGLQKSIVNLFKKINCINTHCILLLEHNPVYTIGIRQYDPANDYSDAAILELEKLGAEFVRTDRGGLITYHGPGQLMAYPIINLRCPNIRYRNLRWYIGALETAGKNVCADYGLKASAGGPSSPGVWLNSTQKVMAIGIRQSNFITYHGVALNCSNDLLSWMQHIVPCGLVDRQVTCLNDACNELLDIRQIAIRLSNHIIQCLFDLETVDGSRCIVDCQYLDEFFNDWTTFGANGSFYNDDESHKNLWAQTVKAILFQLGLSKTSRVSFSDVIVNEA